MVEREESRRTRLRAAGRGRTDVLEVCGAQAEQGRVGTEREDRPFAGREGAGEERQFSRFARFRSARRPRGRPVPAGRLDVAVGDQSAVFGRRSGGNGRSTGADFRYVVDNGRG